MKARSANTSRRAKRGRTAEPRRTDKHDSASKTTRALTEDEADILYGEKHKDDKGIPWDQVKAKLDALDR